MAAASISCCSILLVSLLFIAACHSAVGEDNRYTFKEPIGSYCYANPKFNLSRIANLTQKIDKARDEVVKHARYSSFVNSTIDENTEYPIYALAQCRGDVSPSECHTCIELAAAAIIDLCKYQPDSRVWYDRCFMRFDTEDYLQRLDVGCYVHHTTPQLVPSTMTNFSDVRYQFFTQDMGQEIVKPENRGYAKASKRIDNFNTIYGICQCTGDLDPDESFLGMTSAVQLFDTYCPRNHGCVIASSSCYVKYDLYPFFTNHKGRNNGSRKLMSSHDSP
ncbi:hypothetical protein Droror1_Dr00003889 [Drosera rotundifolia]